MSNPQRKKAYTPTEMEVVMNTNLSYKERAALLPGRTEKGIEQRYYKERDGKVMYNTAGKKAAETRRKNAMNDLPVVIKHVDKTSNFKLIVDSVTYSIDPLIKEVIIGRDSIIINR